MNYPLSRRSFLRLSTATAISQLVGGCGRFGGDSQILFLENSIPLQLIKDFRQANNSLGKIDFKPQTQLAQIFARLNSLKSAEKPSKKDKNVLEKILNKSIIYPDLTTLGDAWLSSAIEKNLLQPLAVEDLANWQKLPNHWKQIVTRDQKGQPSASGKIYGAPYRGGGVVIAYQSKKLAELNLEIKDWQDLWQPELRDRLALIDSPREIIGLTLKKLGKSYNTQDLTTVPELESALSALHQQVRLYSRDRYLESLVLKDTWVAVGWSTDIIPLLKRYPDLKLAVPTSGTSLWADLWVKPRLDRETKDEAEDIDLQADRQISKAWINFCWQPQAIKQISLFTDGVSPLLSTLDPAELPADLQDDPWLNLTESQSAKNEFLQPLNSTAQKQYRDLWLKTRKEVFQS